MLKILQKLKPLPKSIHVSFDKLIKDSFIQPNHYELVKELVSEYGEFYLPDELVNPELGRLQHCVNIATIVNPGFYVIDTQELGCIGVVSGVEHLGKIQVDIALLKQYTGKRYGRSILNTWCDTLLSLTDLPLVTTLTNQKAFDFYVKAGWKPTGNGFEVVFNQDGEE